MHPNTSSQTIDCMAGSVARAAEGRISDAAPEARQALAPGFCAPGAALGGAVPATWLLAVAQGRAARSAVAGLRARLTGAREPGGRPAHRRAALSARPRQRRARWRAPVLARQPLLPGAPRLRGADTAQARRRHDVPGGSRLGALQRLA